MRVLWSRRARLIGGAAGGVAVLGLVAGLLSGPATAKTAAPSTGAVFNNPLGSAEQEYAIRDHILGLVEASDPGSSITTSIYHITEAERGFADALVAASDRGVHVRVVLESAYATDPSARAIVDGLGTDQSQPSWAAICDAGCMGTKINHNKFYLFSSVEGQDSIVVQASANLTVSNATSFWNNAVTFVGNDLLYDGYLDYFDDLARNSDNPDYYTTHNADNVKSYHFPRAGSGASTDTVHNTLGNVGCAADGRSTAIRIGMWYFGRTAVAQRLADLAAQGCTVDIVYTEMTDGPYAELSGQPNVELRRLPEDGETIIHSKYMLIDGVYVDTARKVVFTGSPNYSTSALRRNDETMLRIYSDQIHDQYVANFTDVWNAAG